MDMIVILLTTVTGITQICTVDVRHTVVRVAVLVEVVEEATRQTGHPTMASATIMAVAITNNSRLKITTSRTLTKPIMPKTTFHRASRK